MMIKVNIYRVPNICQELCWPPDEKIMNDTALVLEG